MARLCGSASELMQGWFYSQRRIPKVDPMENQQHLILKSGLDISRIERRAQYRVVHAVSRANPMCPVCDTRSKSLHNRYQRRKWDMPIQGVAVRLNVQARRWRCHNEGCGRRIC